MLVSTAEPASWETQCVAAFCHSTVGAPVQLLRSKKTYLLNNQLVPFRERKTILLLPKIDLHIYSGSISFSPTCFSVDLSLPSFLHTPDPQSWEDLKALSWPFLSRWSRSPTRTAGSKGR